MTGESFPWIKQKGDSVSSGTVNQFGSFDMQATRVGEDSSIQRMIRLVQSAGMPRKAKIVGICRSLGNMDCRHRPCRGRADLGHQRSNHTRCNHPCCILPLCPGARHPHCNHGSHWKCNPPWLSSARRGMHWERLALVRKIAFDKTGTLTLGIPRVLAAVSCSAHWTE